MDARQAAGTLEVIRTLMERTVQYQLLTARAAVVAGFLAGAGALSFLIPNLLDAADPWHFGLVWGLVFAGSLLATTLGTVWRGRVAGEKVWSRQARAVLVALTPSVFAAVVLSVFFFARGEQLWLPGVWMLCYGQGALATSSYAPSPIRWLGISALLMACVTLTLGPEWANVMMGLVFGVGHLGLGTALILAEQKQAQLKLHKSVA